MANPYTRIARLRSAGEILEEEYHDGCVDVTADVPRKLAGQVRKECGVPSC